MFAKILTNDLMYVAFRALLVYRHGSRDGLSQEPKMNTKISRNAEKDPRKSVPPSCNKAILALPTPTVSSAKKANPLSRPPAPLSAQPATVTTNKQTQIIAMLHLPEGATLTDLMEATGWQAHSVRGVISGALRKRLGLAITSERTEDGTRCYRIATRMPA